MSTSALPEQPSRTLPALDRAALITVLVTTWLLLHAHGIAEGAIALADACFLARSALARDWAWLRTPWLRLGLVWWAWLVLCSIPVPSLGLGEGGVDSLAQALATLRFLIFVVALERCVLAEARVRRWMFGIVAAAAAYISLQVLVQFAVGYNLYGEAPGRGGELTGPFGKPRAGPPLSRLLLPAGIPPPAALPATPGTAGKTAASALPVAPTWVTGPY